MRIALYQSLKLIQPVLKISFQNSDIFTWFSTGVTDESGKYKCRSFHTVHIKRDNITIIFINITHHIFNTIYAAQI